MNYLRCQMQDSFVGRNLFSVDCGATVIAVLGAPMDGLDHLLMMLFLTHPGCSSKYFVHVQLVQRFPLLSYD